MNLLFKSKSTCVINKADPIGGDLIKSGLNDRQFKECVFGDERILGSIDGFCLS